MTDNPTQNAAQWAQDEAKALIQGYIAPDHKVQNMKLFFSALSQALDAAYERGNEEGLLLGGQRGKLRPLPSTLDS